jgi:CubicO group peptidase (beta-lactamase class C family)
VGGFIRIATICPPLRSIVFAMRPQSLACLLLLWITLPSSAQDSSIRRLDGTAISADQAKTIADTELNADHVMGAQLAVLNGGHVVWTYASGQRNAEMRLPMTENTDIWAASVTKAVFATWVMRLAEQHLIDLDQPVAQMLPRPLNEYMIYHDSAADLVRDPRWQQVTPRILLSHTSGLANMLILEPGKKLRLHFAPGTRFAYSGEGLDILQFALEKKLNSPLDVAMQRDIFGPLGMTRTSMIWRPDFFDNTALRYSANGRYLNTSHKDRPRAAGSMITTIHDLGIFTEALLANKILQADTTAKMLSPQIIIRTAHQFPTFAPDTSGEGEKVGLAYGLGWGLLTKTPFGPAFFKEGHGEGAENYMVCFTQSGTCMILLTNSENGDLAFRPLLEKLIGDNVTPLEWEGYTRGGIPQKGDPATPK